MTAPSNFEKEYDGAAADLTTTNWYTTDLVGNSSVCQAIYKKPDNSPTNLSAIIDVGTYSASYTLQGRYVWASGDATDKKRDITITVTKKKLQVDFKLNNSGLPTLTLVDQPIASDNANPGDFTLLIRYYDSTGKDLGTDSSVLKKGTQYQATAEFGGPRGKNYAPKDDTPRLTFTNPAAQVTTSWPVTNGTRVYNGKNQSFSLSVTSGGTPVGVTTKLAESYGSDVSVNGLTCKATNAGRYGVTLTLTNKAEYVWATTGRSDDITVYFEITAVTVRVNILSLTPATPKAGQKTNASVETEKLISGTVRMKLYAYADGVIYGDSLCTIDLSSDTTTLAETYELATNLLDPYSYTLGLVYDDPNDVNAKNYNVILGDDSIKALTVDEASATGGINWRLMSGNSLVGTQADDADTNIATYENSIVYDGRSYRFTANVAGLGHSVDSSYNDNGFTNGYKTVKKGTSTVVSDVKDAGEYVTTVRLQDTTDEYSIEWKIDKAKFDLSNVKWEYDGKIPFKQNGMNARLDPETVPDGLIPAYGGAHSATTVGQKGTASVTFTVADTTNYVVPDGNNKASYRFTATSGGPLDFEWSKAWEVVAVEIPVFWMSGTITVNNKPVNAQILAGGYDDYVNYVYYETDSMGNVTNNTPLNEPTVVDNTVKYYIAEVSIKPEFASTYKFKDGTTSAALRSSVFEAGKALTAVTLAAKKTSYTYWGNPVKFQFNVASGAISQSAFTIIYYRGNVRLGSAPSEVGNYTARIQLNSGYTGQYYIQGAYSFAYTIDRATIKIDWNNNTKPPVLKLTAEEKACVSYVYRDSVGNTVSFAGLSTPGTYGVCAKITNPKNYVFDNGLTVTDWEQFTVTSSTVITNPDDVPPYNPSTDPNGGGSDDPNPPSGKTQVTVSLTNPTVAYNGNGQRAQLTNSAGLDASAFNVVYKLNGAIVAAPTAAGSYTVEITLLAAYANNYELTGTTSYTLTVTKGILSNEWYDYIVPPILKVTSGQAKALRYEYRDAQGTVVPFSSLTAGNSYEVRAVITDGNYVFTDNTTETAWKPFTLASGVTPLDPTDPTNPYNPYNPNYNPNDPNSPNNPNSSKNPYNPNYTGPNGDGSGADLSNVPLWQLIVGGVSAVLLAVFIGKTASNVSHKKNYDKKAKKAEAKTFSFAGMGVLLSLMWGMEETWWTVIACSLLGLAAIMLVVMLVTGSQRKKAEEACEEAVAGAEQRRLEAERLRREEEREEERRRQEEKEEKEQRRREEREEADRRKRDEDMKMMLMMMRGGGNGGEESYGYTAYNNPMDVGAVVSQVISGLLPSIQGMLPAPAPSHDEELAALREEIRELKSDRDPQVTVVDNSEELAALREEIRGLKNDREPQVVERVVVKKTAEEDEDDEDWTDDDEEDFYEEVSEEGDLVEEAAPATEQRTRLPLNFRVRLKASSEKNHNAYVEIKNLLNSYKGISFRMSGRTEKVKYQGEVIAIIGVARKSLKLWLALNPFAYDEKRYHQKDASEKVSYAQTPMLVRVGSERALKRVSELIGELMAKFSVEQRKKYTDKDLQVLAYTLKRNALLKAKKTDLLRGSIHVHDTDVISNDEANEYLEQKERGAIGKENFATVSLDTLEEQFFDGQKVTLEKLKKKGLVAEECNGYRVTAGERLTKPLYVVADEFSTSAVKMLVLTGGRAVQLFDPFAKQ